MNRLVVFTALLLLLAIFAAVMYVPYMFPPESIAACNKLNTGSGSMWGGDNYYYANCVRAVAAIKGERGLCTFISSQQSIDSCGSQVKGPLSGYDQIWPALKGGQYSFFESSRMETDCTADTSPDSYWSTTSCPVYYALKSNDMGKCAKAKGDAIYFCRAVVLASQGK